MKNTVQYMDIYDFRELIGQLKDVIKYNFYINYHEMPNIVNEYIVEFFKEINKNSILFNYELEKEVDNYKFYNNKKIGVDIKLTEKIKGTLKNIGYNDSDCTTILFLEIQIYH